jgi:hypothetical protein
MGFLLNLDIQTHSQFIYFWSFLGLLWAMSVLVTGMVLTTMFFYTINGYLLD